MLNASFLDYRMPTSLDLPMIETVLVEVANPGHPFGLRGVGEVPIVPPMAAIANAIYRRHRRPHATAPDEPHQSAGGPVGEAEQWPSWQW